MDSDVRPKKKRTKKPFWQQRTWTFQPEKKIKQLVIEKIGWTPERGVFSKFVNDSLRGRFTQKEFEDMALRCARDEANSGMAAARADAQKALDEKTSQSSGGSRPR